MSSDSEFQKAFFERWKKDDKSTRFRILLKQWWLVERRNFSKFLKYLEFTLFSNLSRYVKSVFQRFANRFSSWFIKHAKSYYKYIYIKYVLKVFVPFKKAVNRVYVVRLFLFIFSWSYYIIFVSIVGFILFVFVPVGFLVILSFLLFDLLVFYVFPFFAKTLTKILFVPTSSKLHDTRFARWARSFDQVETSNVFFFWVYSRFKKLRSFFAWFFKTSHTMYIEYWIWHYGELYAEEDSDARRIEYSSVWTWSDEYFDSLSDYERLVRYRYVTRLVIIHGIFYDLPFYGFELFLDFFSDVFQRRLPLYVYKTWKLIIQSLTLFYYGEVAEYSRPVEQMELVLRGFRGRKGLPLLTDKKSTELRQSNLLSTCLGTAFLNLEAVIAVELENQRKQNANGVPIVEPKILLETAQLKKKKRFTPPDEKEYLRVHYKWMFDDTRKNSKFYSWEEEEGLVEHSAYDPYPLVPVRLGIYTGIFAGLQRRLDELDWVNYVETKARAWRFRNDTPDSNSIEKRYEFDTYNYNGYWHSWADEFFYNDVAVGYRLESMSPLDDDDDEPEGKKPGFLQVFFASFWFIFCVGYALFAFFIFPFVAFFQFINQVTGVPIVELFWYYSGYYSCFILCTLPMNWRVVFWPMIKFKIYLHVYARLFKPIFEIFYPFFIRVYQLVCYILEPIIRLLVTSNFFMIPLQVSALALVFFFIRRFCFTSIRLWMIVEYVFSIIMEIICWIRYFVFIFPDYRAPYLVRKYFYRIVLYEFHQSDAITNSKLRRLTRVYNHAVLLLRFSFVFLFSLFRYIPFSILIWFTHSVFHNSYHVNTLCNFIYELQFFFYPVHIHPYTIVTCFQIILVWVFRYACPPFSRFFERELLEVYWGCTALMWFRMACPKPLMWLHSWLKPPPPMQFFGIWILFCWLYCIILLLMKAEKYRNRVNSIFSQMRKDSNQKEDLLLTTSSFESVLDATRTSLEKSSTFDIKGKSKLMPSSVPVSLFSLIKNTCILFCIVTPIFYPMFQLCLISAFVVFTYYFLTIVTIQNSSALFTFICLPLFFAFFLYFFTVIIGRKSEMLVKLYSFWCSFFVFFCSVMLFCKLPDTQSDILNLEPDEVYKNVSIAYNEFYIYVWDWLMWSHCCVDGFSIYFIMFTTFSVFICVCASWKLDFKSRCSEYFVLFFIMEFFLMHVFTQQNLFFFFIFFEAVLIPMFILIGVWGSRTEQRFDAACRFFMYTFVGSVAMLIAIFYIYALHFNLDWFYFFNYRGFFEAHVTDLYRLRREPFSETMKQIQWNNWFVWGWFDPLGWGHYLWLRFWYVVSSETGLVWHSEQWLSMQPFTETEEFWLWLAFSISFLVKIPLVPFHTWLPEAHVEAPTPVSMFLAGVLLKMGGYGYLHFCLVMFPFASKNNVSIFICLCLLSMIYASWCALCHIDLKKIVAYSSIAHMGFAMLGLAGSPSVAGLLGSAIMMISHGFVSMGLFFSVGFLYERYGVRNITYYSNISAIHPVFASFFLFFCFANIAFPGTSSFVAEFVLLISFANRWPVLIMFTCVAIIFSAVYTIWMYNRLCWGSQPMSEKLVEMAENHVIRNVLFRFFRFHRAEAHVEQHMGFFYSYIMWARFIWYEKIFYDCNFREVVIMASLTFFILFIGFFPSTCFAYTPDTAFFYSCPSADDLDFARLNFKYNYENYCPRPLSDFRSSRWFGDIIGKHNGYKKISYFVYNNPYDRGTRGWGFLLL